MSVSRSALLDEYDFRGGARGKYAARFAEGTCLVVLDPDVAELFPDSAAVNEALRLLGKLARAQVTVAGARMPARITEPEP